MKIRLWFLLVLAVLFGACAAFAAPAETAEKVKIAYSVNNMDETKSMYVQFFDEYFSRHPETEFHWTSAEGNAEKQLGDVETFIAQKVDVIFVSVIDPTALAATVDAAHAAGIKMVSYGDKLNHPDVDFEVGNRPYDYGVVQGHVINKWLEKNPSVNLKIGYIRGDLASQQVADTYNGLMDTCKKAFDDGRMEIIVDNTATWRSADAMLLAEDWLQTYSEINCIITQNDEMAIGAIQALKASGKTLGKDVFVFGKDGNAHGRTYIESGEMEGTVFIDHRASCYYFVDIINRYAHGEKFEKTMIPDYTLFLHEMTKETMADCMAESDRKFAELGKK